MTLGKLMTAIHDIRAKALFANNPDTAADGYAKYGFELEMQDLGFVNEVLNAANPLAAYGLNVSPSKDGSSLEIRYNLYNAETSDLITKSAAHTPLYLITNQDIEGTVYGVEYHRWNLPKHKTEGIMGIDLKLGVPNLLAKRASTFVHEYAYQSGLAVLEDAMDGSAAVIVADDTTATHMENAIAAYQTITTEALKLTKVRGFVMTLDTKDSQVTVVRTFNGKPKLNKAKGEFAAFIKVLASDIQIMLEPTMFAKMTLSGLTGDRTSNTFANGIFSVTEAGGIKVVQDSGFLPEKVAGTAASGIVDRKLDTNGAPTVTTLANCLGYIGTSYNIVHELDVLQSTVFTTNTKAQVSHVQVRDLRVATKLAGKLGVTLIDKDFA